MSSRRAAASGGGWGPVSGAWGTIWAAVPVRVPWADLGSRREDAESGEGHPGCHPATVAQRGGRWWLKALTSLFRVSGCVPLAEGEGELARALGQAGRAVRGGRRRGWPCPTSARHPPAPTRPFPVALLSLSVSLGGGRLLASAFTHLRPAGERVGAGALGAVVGWGPSQRVGLLWVQRQCPTSRDGSGQIHPHPQAVHVPPTRPALGHPQPWRPAVAASRFLSFWHFLFLFLPKNILT